MRVARVYFRLGTLALMQRYAEIRKGDRPIEDAFHLRT
jgi:hypothetical protein